jgi:hypothetical protein
MPSYFCQQVVADTRRSVDVRIYPWSPLDARPEPVVTSDGDVVFVPAMFGAAPSVEVQGHAVVIEDHSHDLLSPWAMASTADYAVASLRKTLPLPDGGVAWSPRDLEVPSAPAMTTFHAATVALRLSAMVLKHHYLAGHDVGKQVFRDADLEGERMMASGPDTGISTYSRARLPTLPVGPWRSRRARNLTTLRAEVHELSGARFLDASFAAVLLFDDPARRSAVRQALIAHDVYPAVLWPLEHPAVDGIPPVHVETSRRALAISVDQRYGTADMQRAAAILTAALEAT